MTIVWNSLRGEGRPATAGFLRVRVDEVEALLHQRLFVVQHHAVQVDEALRVHEQAHTIELIHAVALTRLRIEADVVAQSAASAALYAHAKSALFRRNILLRHGYADLLQRALRHLNAFGIRRGAGRVDDGAGVDRRVLRHGHARYFASA